MSTKFRRSRSGLYIPRDAYALAIMSDSPKRYYDFKEPVGSSVLIDRSGNSQDGTPVGSPTPTGDGWSLDGSTQYFTIPSTGLPAGNSHYTIEWIAKPSNVTGQHNVVTFGSPFTNQENGTGFNGTNAWNYYNSFNATTSGVTIDTVNWWHYWAVYNASTLRILINGVQRVSVARTSHNTVLSTSYIGRAENGTNLFAGLIRRAAIWDTDLSDARNAAHFAVAPLT